MTRVVADTNIFISALMFDGRPGVFLDHDLVQAFTLVTSAVLLDELADKVRHKFSVVAEDIATIRGRLEGVAVVVTPNVALSVVHHVDSRHSGDLPFG